ncbi:hypothetical protein Tco_1385568 [Tanacetum coccineum]
MEEREMYIIKERSKLLAKFFERRKKLLAEERAAVVRNKPPTRTQLRSLMMTYLKHIDFVSIGSERGEKMIHKMNKKAAGMDEEDVPKESESTKVEVKQEGREENIKKRSGRRLKIKATKKSKRQKTDTDFEEEEQLRASLRIVPNEEEEIDYEIMGTRIMFKETADDNIWKNQEKWIIKSWTFYENCGVHILALKDGTEIHMLAERSKELASPKQTALGKDNSNPLIVGSWKRISEKRTKNQAKTDKIKHGMEKR